MPVAHRKLRKVDDGGVEVAGLVPPRASPNVYKKKFKYAKEARNDGLIVPRRISYDIDKIMEKHQQKYASIQFRHDLIQKQNRSNYQNEFDRLKGMIDDRTVLGLRGQDITKLQNRQQELKQLHKKSVFSDRHELYN
jgi:hypothetical protein